MASSASFGHLNSGAQIGVNRGQVNYHFHAGGGGENETNTRPWNESQTHYIIPSLENRHFTGRESTLEELKQKLFIQANTEKLALFGLGGIGKTQLALQLARWVKAHIPECSIFWTPALSLESFDQACSQIAKELQIHRNPDVESAMESVQRYLSSAKAGKWLFIIDNADDIDLLFDKLDQYFPTSNKGVTLLTTRSREVALSFAGRDIVELQKMTTDEGVAFLNKIVGEDLLCDQKSTIQFLEELNFLPLAIVQAAYYICRNGGTTARYLELMHKTEKDRMRLASREFHDSTRYRRMTNAVATTWLISFNQIRDSNPSAADLLEFISYLEPKAIPRSILPTLDSEEEMEFSIGTLCNYGFLTRRDDENMFDMHSLVQLSTRVWLTDKRKTQQIIATLTQHMDKHFPSDEYTNRGTWKMYLPHAFEILRREESQDMSERYFLLFKVGRCILKDDRTKEAVTYLKDVCAWSERQYHEEHPDRLAFQHALAEAYGSNGQTKQAVELLEHVVAVRERTLHEEDRDRLTAQHALAVAYRSNGQIKQAVEIFEYVAAVKERTLDGEHPDQLASQHSLAVAYTFNGQIKQAVELLEHVVSVRERTLDEEHPDRLTSQYALAVVYGPSGQIKQAVEMFEYVAAVEERTLNEEHHDRLTAQHALGWAYVCNGQIKQAIELLEHVVAVQERTLDEEHRNRLTSQHALAVAYLSNGQIKQAVELLEYVVAVRERTLHDEHPDRLTSQTALAGVYVSNGQIKQAIELLEHVVALRERTLDEKHYDRLMSQHALAEAYRCSGQVKQAIELLEHVVALRERTLDEKHHDRLMSQRALQDIKKSIELATMEKISSSPSGIDS